MEILTRFRLPSWLVSMAVHGVALLILAWLTTPVRQPLRAHRILSLVPDKVPLEEVVVETATTQDSPEADFEPDELSQVSELPPVPTEVALPSLSEVTEIESVAPSALPLLDALTSATDDGLLTEVAKSTGGGFDGRDPASRSRMVREGGGSIESERAVKWALQWFKQHQFPNGAWSLNPMGPKCNCSHPGKMKQAPLGATSLALLPFLAAGNTHRTGEFQQQVKGGLGFLLAQQQPSGALVDVDGTLYSHALGTIVLTEAYAMSKDKRLKRPAEAAIRYIAFAQDPRGGGWRYQPKQPGDTSVVAWQMMALKSGQMAKLRSPRNVYRGVEHFLDSVQQEEGAAYGYQRPGRRTGTTAAGLLARMYLGWEHSNPALSAGVARLAKSGPSKVDMYYNYYATQVMRHYGGDTWEGWNRKMRELLVGSQEKAGHEHGSWHLGSSHAAVAGGRLYNTAMATLVLEVYYRHLPLYRKFD